MSALDELGDRREAEHRAWSTAEGKRLASGDLASLEGAITGDAVGDLRPEDRVALIEAFVERCRCERPAVAPAPGSPTPIRHHTRRPRSLKPAREPVAPGRPLPGLSLHRHVAWAVALWAVAVGSGALVLKLLFAGN